MSRRTPWTFRGHAEILREQLDGAVGMSAKSMPLSGRDSAFPEARHATIEPRATDPGLANS